MEPTTEDASVRDETADTRQTPTALSAPGGTRPLHRVARALAIGAIAVVGFTVAGTAVAGPSPKPSPTKTTTTTTTTTTSSSGSSGTTSTTTTTTTSSSGSSTSAFMRKSLTDAVKAGPDRLFDVIVKGKKGVNTTSVSSEVASVQSAVPGNAKGITKKYAKALNAVAAQLTGRQVSSLATRSKISSITLDGQIAFTAVSNTQLWPVAADVDGLWASGAAAPAIAIVDTGVDSARAADFGARVVAEAKLTIGRNNSPGDGRGHGTFVASIAAGAAPGYAGVAPGANIVSLDVMDDDGVGRMSDVIAAADWILQNRTKYNIRVANFSLQASETSSFMYDPVNQAVEKLWFSGIVVVAAAGNYGSGATPSGVQYAPGNDPFVITVGASDIARTERTSDDFNAPWSAWGYTLDGFAKPELGAPGRYMNGAAPETSSMYTQHPERVVAPGYMWMSGTSFAAPVVAGIAAQILALHPTFTPDQVKGALMLAASPAGAAVANSLGVGVVRGAAAAAIADPPNPNLALNRFLVSDPDTGGTMFDAASWTSAAKADASWNTASWTSASWTSASWTSASWTSASWTSASWTSASWTSGQTTDGTLPAASWTSLSWLS